MSNDITVPARNHSHGSAKSKPGKKRRNGPVSYMVVNKSVWDAALLLAERKVERVEIISPTKVEVWIVGGKAG